MAIGNDIFSVNIITEFKGVQMSNKTYWQIYDIGDDPAINTALSDFIIAYHNAIKSKCSDLWSVVCGVWENITTPEGKHVVFSSLAGTSLNTGHPQFQVLRFNRYAQNVAADSIKRGAFNQSGIEELQSVRGRWTDDAQFNLLNQFLTLASILGGTGWTIQHHLRWTLALGPP